MFSAKYTKAPKRFTELVSFNMICRYTLYTKHSLYNYAQWSHYWGDWVTLDGELCQGPALPTIYVCKALNDIHSPMATLRIRYVCTIHHVHFVQYPRITYYSCVQNTNCYVRWPKLENSCSNVMEQLTYHTSLRSKTELQTCKSSLTTVLFRVHYY